MTLTRSSHIWDDNINTDYKDTECEFMVFSHKFQDTVQTWDANELSDLIKGGDYVEQLSDCWLFQDSAPRI
jgi:hypothetical protein